MTMTAAALAWTGCAILGVVYATAAQAADPPGEQQMQRLLDSAARYSDRADHDFAANSIANLLAQGKDIGLTPEQTDKIKGIQERYAQTKSSKEAAYQQSEMEALKLIHDRHSSLSAVETAVQKADQEHSKLRMAGISALREASDVLRPEQYAKWRQSHVLGQVAKSGEGGEPAAEPERIAPH
jgi:hypothetical protein